jgi:hypothetical protein
VHIISYVGDKLIVMPGRRFGRLKVVREGPGQPVKGKTYRRRTMICRCRCGSPDKEILLWLLTPGGTQSCGCLRRELAPLHAKAVAKAPVRKPSRAEMMKARIIELEAQNRRLTAELGAMRLELEMTRGIVGANGTWVTSNN